MNKTPTSLDIKARYVWGSVRGCGKAQRSKQWKVEKIIKSGGFQFCSPCWSVRCRDLEDKDRAAASSLMFVGWLYCPEVSTSCMDSHWDRSHAIGHCDHCGHKNYILSEFILLLDHWMKGLFNLNALIVYKLAWNHDSNISLNFTLESSISPEQFTFKH